MDLAVFCALQLTPEPPEFDDLPRLRDFSDTRTALAPRLPRAVVLGCGASGALVAMKGILDVKAALDPDWITLECCRANSWSNEVDLVRTTLSGEQCIRALTEARPEVLIGNACHRYDAQSPGETAAQQAAEIVDTFAISWAQPLLVECPAGVRAPA